MYEHPLTETLLARLAEPAEHIIFLTGPRQVGKTTLVRQLLANHRPPASYLYCNCDVPVGSAAIASTPNHGATSSANTLRSAEASDQSPTSSATESATATPIGKMPDLAWLTEQWEKARTGSTRFVEQSRQALTDSLTAPLPPATSSVSDPGTVSATPPSAMPFVLVLDEVQQIPGWSRAVKGLWDADDRLEQPRPMHVVLLGSSPLLMQHGLDESMAGRFRELHMTHWSFEEMNKAFEVTLDEYLFFGGYPGSMKFTRNALNRGVELATAVTEWKANVRDSLIEPSIKRDILAMRQVRKPALLKDVFDLGCLYSGQLQSYCKLQGRLKDAGNTTTVAHYLSLLNDAGLLTGLQKYAHGQYSRKASSPKLMVYNTALMTATSAYGLAEALADRTYRGRLTETAVGAHLLNGVIRRRPDFSVYYWQNGNCEVDFVLVKGKGDRATSHKAIGDKVIAIEVKSGPKVGSLRGLDEFKRQFPRSRQLVVSEQNVPGKLSVPLGEFLQNDLREWFSRLWSQT